MRTTISLEDRLGQAARERAAEQGMSLSAYIASLLQDALTRRPDPVDAPPFRLITAGGQGVHSGVDLDRTSALLTADDEARYRGR